jgi:hypothetical protein
MFSALKQIYLIQKTNEIQKHKTIIKQEILQLS